METKEIAEGLTSKLLDLMGVKSKIEVESTPAGCLRVNTFVDDAGFLIGRDGENLRALQYILMLLVSKESKEMFYPGNFVFDINHYQQGKEGYLQALARNTADQVIQTKKSIELNPMGAAERRIVHLAVEQLDGVKSESVGEGLERRVVILPTRHE